MRQDGTPPPAKPRHAILTDVHHRRPVTAITIYSRPGCHLCDEMKAVVSKVIAHRSDVTIEEIDISTDAALETRYGLEIPVLLVDGRKAAKYRIEEHALRRLLG